MKKLADWTYTGEVVEDGYHRCLVIVPVGTNVVDIIYDTTLDLPEFDAHSFVMVPLTDEGGMRLIGITDQLHPAIVDYEYLGNYLEFTDIEVIVYDPTDPELASKLCIETMITTW